MQGRGGGRHLYDGNGCGGIYHWVCVREDGLSGLSEEAARRATDKAAMKEAFFSEGVSAARFYKARTLEDVAWAAGELGFPVVVKRVDSSGAGNLYCQRTCRPEGGLSLCPGALG